MHVNRNFKNSVFTTLFDNPDLLRELYCALEDVTLSPDTPVSITTLENVLYMDLYNDISFEIDGKLVILVEHQSTLNPNMALRLMSYFNKLMEKITRSSAIYSKKLIHIPRPEFYVLYNGTDPFPDEEIMRLSDHFEKPQSLGLPEKPYPMMELEVRVLNINEGKNQVIANRCKKLAEYSAFIAKARYFIAEFGNKEEGIKTAIKYCQNHDILKEFLEVHGSEVLNMVFLEWNTEDAIAYAREEGREEGREEVREEEREKSRQDKLAIARKALAKGLTPEYVSEITDLSLNEIANI